MYARTHGSTVCPGEVRRPLLGSFGSSGGCTVTTCTRPYRHFRHPRASTSLQLDGSNWTTNGHVVIRTRHLSATPFALSAAPHHQGPLLPSNSNAESLTGYQSVCRVTHLCSCSCSCSCSSCPSTWSIFVFSTLSLPLHPKRVSFSRNLERTWKLDRRRSRQFFIDLTEILLPRNDASLLVTFGKMIFQADFE